MRCECLNGEWRRESPLDRSESRSGEKGRRRAITKAPKNLRPRKKEVRAICEINAKPLIKSPLKFSAVKLIYLLEHPVNIVSSLTIKNLRKNIAKNHVWRFRKWQMRMANHALKEQTPFEKLMPDHLLVIQNM